VDSPDLHYAPRPKWLPRRGAAFALAVIVIGGVIGWNYEYAAETFDAPIDGQVLMGADGRSLTVEARWSGCEGQPKLVARESEVGVQLALRREDHSTADMVCDEWQGRQLHITLKAPLGYRDLTNRVGHGPIALLDERTLAQPHYLPIGYTQTDSGGGINTKAPAWTRTYGGKPGDATLSITQSPEAAPDPGNGTPVAVNGHPGRLQDQGLRSRALTWSDGSRSFVVSSQEPQGDALSVEELTRIAEGLY
jgi:hypothetical protein